MPPESAGASNAALPRDFYARPTLIVAPDLLGRTLVRDLDGEQRAGRIVEVEAYVGPDDRASHASRGLTPRTALMFGPAGHAYVYLVYGMHHCLNVVTEDPGFPAAILIRALEPLSSGLEDTRGPARLCRALAIDRGLNGLDMTRPGPLYVTPGRPAGPDEVATSPRIGVTYAGEWAAKPWRFYLRDNPWVSRPSAVRAAQPAARYTDPAGRLRPRRRGPDDGGGPA